MPPNIAFAKQLLQVIMTGPTPVVFFLAIFLPGVLFRNSGSKELQSSKNYLNRILGIIHYITSNVINIRRSFPLFVLILHGFFQGIILHVCQWLEIPVLVRSLKSSILSSTSFQMGKTFWRVVSAALEQFRREANMVAQGDGKFGP